MRAIQGKNMLIADKKLFNHLIVTILITATLIPASLSAQTAPSPVAPKRELVEQVVREAYEKFKTDTSGKMQITFSISRRSIRSYLGSRS
jgi:hypothetical protein